MKSLPFLPLLPGPDSHGLIEVKVNFKVIYMGTSTYSLEDTAHKIVIDISRS